MAFTYLQRNKKIKALKTSEEGFETEGFYEAARESNATAGDRLGYAEDSAILAGKAFLNLLTSATKCLFYTVGTIGQLLSDGVGSFSEDGTWAKKAASNGLNIIKNTAEVFGYGADAMIELGIASTIKTAPFVEAAASKVFSAVKATSDVIHTKMSVATLAGLDYILGGEEAETVNENTIVASNSDDDVDAFDTNNADDADDATPYNNHLFEAEAQVEFQVFSGVELECLGDQESIDAFSTWGARDAMFDVDFS